MLPYRTLEEAALALARNLTLAEKLWYNYSAHKSDLLLYSHNVFFLCLMFSLAPLPYAFIELSQSEVMAKFKVQTNIKRSFFDMFKCYKDVKWAEIHPSLPLPSFWEISSKLIVYFLIEDYTNYWLHRLLHSKWGYEKIHYMHHEYSTPIGFAAPCAHWAEILILGIPTFLGPLMIPCHIITLCLWIIFRHVEAIHTHSGYEFPWSPTKFIPFYVGAEYHDYHHYVGGQRAIFLQFLPFAIAFMELIRVTVNTSKLAKRYSP